MAVIAAALTLSFGSAQAQRPLGVDVSNNNGGGINWGGVKGAGFTYAWAKATEGTYFIDPDFTQNENNGKGAGVVMGAYDFSRPDLQLPATEAAYFWAEAGGYINADGLTLQPSLDIETFAGVHGGGTYSQWVNNWCNDIKNYASLKGVGVTPFVYTTTCESCNLDTSVAQWLSWIANPNGESSQTGTPWTACTSCDVWGAGAWNAWQYYQPGTAGITVSHMDQDSLSAALFWFQVYTTTQHSPVNRMGMAGTPSGQGYWIVGSDGGVFSFGDAQFYGSMGGKTLNAPVVGMAARPQGDGYWLVGSDGGIFTFGNAGFYGSMGGQHLNAPIVAICATASGNGYWLVGADGGIFTFGDAPFNGSMGGQHINAPIVGMASTSGNGYWLVGSDGGIYSFGATFYGSMGGTHLSAPVVGMSAHTTGNGYWLTGSDGAMYCFGSAPYDGGMNGTKLSQPIVAVQGTHDGNGYWLVGHDGAIYTFGDAPYKGGANW